MHNFAASARQVHVLGSHCSPGNTSICTTSHQARFSCTHSDRTLSWGILRSAQLRTKCISSAPARIALFPWEYVDLHHFTMSTHQACTFGSHYSPGNTVPCTTLHDVHIKGARSDRSLGRGILRSAQPCIKRTSRVHTPIALFPWEFFDLHNFAPSAYPVHPLGSHSFPGNTAICTTSP